MDWRWTARRLTVSVFLVVHLAATIVWVLPACPIRARLSGPFSSYMLPLGLWQCWAMFAPDPARESLTLEADVIDVQGIRHAYSFPRLANYSKWRGIPRFRHSKFAYNLLVDEFTKQREFTARHVVRQLGLPAESFPVTVQLFYQVERAPLPGDGPNEPVAPPYAAPLAKFAFSTRDEVLP